MAIEIKQGANNDFQLVDDKSGARVLHAPPNARIKTTLIGQLTQTSPGAIVGLGGETNLNIPGGAVPISLRYFSPVPASTGATITIGIDTTSTYFLNGQNVATLALNGQQVPASVANLGVQLALMPVGSSHVLTGAYAQTSTAPGGGPWYVELDYYVPVPT